MPRFLNFDAANDRCLMGFENSMGVHINSITGMGISGVLAKRYEDDRKDLAPRIAVRFSTKGHDKVKIDSLFQVAEAGGCREISVADFLNLQDDVTWPGSVDFRKKFGSVNLGQLPCSSRGCGVVSGSEDAPESTHP